MSYNTDAGLRIAEEFKSNSAVVQAIVGSCAYGEVDCLCMAKGIVPLAKRFVLTCSNEHGTCSKLHHPVLMHSECYNGKCLPQAMAAVEAKLGSATKTGKEAEKSLWEQRLWITHPYLPKCVCGSNLVPVLNGNREAVMTMQVAYSPDHCSPCAPSLEELKVAHEDEMTSVNTMGSSSSNEPSANMNKDEQFANIPSKTYITEEKMMERAERIKVHNQRRVLMNAERALKKQRDAQKKKEESAKKIAAMSLARARKAVREGKANEEQIAFVAAADSA